MANTDFTLPATGYATFDALSMKQLIKDRLRQNAFYTDQDFEGSNLSSLIDMLAYNYHVLLFYLNQTSTESLFSESQLYENVNRIVKLLNYNPIGFQTCKLQFDLTGSSQLGTGAYAIPQYTYTTASGVQYTLVDDVFFSKTTNNIEKIGNVSSTHVLYQGIPQEYPIQTAAGEEFEMLTILPGNDVVIDHYTIRVYVKNVNTNKWSKWSQVDTLFSESQTAESYQLRLNEHKNYEIRFGNGITGKKLNSGDQIAIYFMKSEGVTGRIGPGSLSKSLTLHTTPQFVQIFNDIKSPDTNYISAADLQKLSISSTQYSTNFYEAETITDIKNNAPNVFNLQNRVITKTDFETIVKSNLGKSIKSIKVVDNDEYMVGHMKYITDRLKLNRPNDDVNTLFNHVQYADSTTFNNTYIYAVPVQSQATTMLNRANYLNITEKNNIINLVKDKKPLTAEVVVVDPVYVGVSVGVFKAGESTDPSVRNKTNIVLTKNRTSPLSDDGIINKAYQIIRTYFEGAELGQTIDINYLVNAILSIPGVDDIHTQRTDDTTVQVPGLSLLLWNPVYGKADATTIAANITLPYYKYPYFHDILSLSERIVIQQAE